MPLRVELLAVLDGYGDLRLGRRRRRRGGEEGRAARRCKGTMASLSKTHVERRGAERRGESEGEPLSSENPLRSSWKSLPVAIFLQAGRRAVHGAAKCHRARSYSTGGDERVALRIAARLLHSAARCRTGGASVPEELQEPALGLQHQTPDRKHNLLWHSGQASQEGATHPLEPIQLQWGAFVVRPSVPSVTKVTRSWPFAPQP